jgi:hypothetical protein
MKTIFQLETISKSVNHKLSTPWRAWPKNGKQKNSWRSCWRKQKSLEIGSYKYNDV